MAEMSDSVFEELNSSIKSSMTAFGLVIFRGIQDTYPVGGDVNCRYTVSGSLEVSSKDWVGLYKVGWRNQTDYLCYDWAPQPRVTGEGETELSGCVLFSGSTLPKDDGEFYQFCYVTAAAQVRGASTPFQFKQATIDDFVEEEDENGELLVIKTKTSVLEEKLKQANELRIQLKQELLMIENERDLLKLSEAELKKRLDQQRDAAIITDKRLREMQSCLSEASIENERLEDRIDALQMRIDLVYKERQEMETRLNDNDRYIGDLQDKIKALVNEKDCLTGRVKSLEEEKELYKGHFTTSESTLQSYVQECEKTKVALLEEQAMNNKYRRDTELLLEAEMNEMKKAQDNLKKALTAEKDNVAYVTERIRNAEDKLSAAEHCKMMLNEEVVTLKQAYDKAAADLQEACLTIDMLKNKQASLSRSLEEADEIYERFEEKEHEAYTLREALKLNSARLHEMEQNAYRLEQELRQRATEESEAPLHALRSAMMALKERYDAVSKKNDAMKKSLETNAVELNELRMTNEDQRREISSLRERVIMSQDECKKKYIEWQRREKEILKTVRRNAHQSESRDSVSSTNSNKEESMEYYKKKAHQYKNDLIELKKTNRLLNETIYRKDSHIKYLEIKLMDKSDQRQDILEDAEEISEAAAKPVWYDIKTELDGAHEAPPTSAYLQAPLTPLPAPLLPERLHRPLTRNYRDVGLNAVTNMISSLILDSSAEAPPTNPAAEAAAPATTVITTSSSSWASSSSSSSSSCTTTTSSNVSVSTTVSVNTAAGPAAGDVNAAAGNVYTAAWTDGATATRTAGEQNGDVEDESFVDASSEDFPPEFPITSECPICHTILTLDTLEALNTEMDHHFTAHHSNTFNAAATGFTVAPENCPAICPMCQKVFPVGEDPHAMEIHVNSHFFQE